MQNKRPLYDQQKQQLQNPNRWRDGNTSQGLNDRGSDYGSMNWDASGRDYHSANDEHRGHFNREAYGSHPDEPQNETRYNQGSNYPASDYGTSNFNQRGARADAEYAFGQQNQGGRGGNYPGRDEGSRNPAYDNSQYTTNFGAGNTGNRSAYRNREDVLGNRGSQYGQNDYDSTRYGESELYGRSRADSPYQMSEQGRYTTENNRDPKSFSSHFGKGPKGYKRSDARIQEDAHEALTRDHDIDASEIEVAVKDGIVTLSGSVSERKMKRLAEDCVERVSGVTDVKNEISTSGTSFFGSSSKSDSKKTSKSSSNNDMM